MEEIKDWKEKEEKEEDKKDKKHHHHKKGKYHIKPCKKCCHKKKHDKHGMQYYTRTWNNGCYKGCEPPYFS